MIVVSNTPFGEIGETPFHFGEIVKIHLAVSRTRSGKYKTLHNEFIPEAQRGGVKCWTATKQFARGDLVLFYFGEPVKSIMGIGVVDFGPYERKGKFYWTSKSKVTFCDFKPVQLLENPLSLKQAAQTAGLQDWYKTAPYRHSRELDPEVAQALLTEIVRLNPKARTLVWNRGVTIPQVKRKTQRSAPSRFQEGGVQEITVELRKRNPRLRVEAIAEYGYSCQVCGFNFEDFYGDIGAQYIEVHHLRPLSERRVQHTTTTEDVRVVCANCHRVLHRNGRKPISLDKLRKTVLDQRKQGGRKR